MFLDITVNAALVALIALAAASVEVISEPESDDTQAVAETILGIEVPLYTMVVAPGRGLAIMLETAVRKCLLAQRGIQDERDFLEVINEIAAKRPDDGWDVDDG